MSLSCERYTRSNPNTTLADTKSKPAPATLVINANNTVAALNSVGNNSVVNIGATLTIGDSQNLSSTLSATITQTGTGLALVKAGSGLLDISGGKLALASGGSVDVTGGQLRVVASEFNGSALASNTFALSTGTELQFAQGRRSRERRRWRAQCR